MVDFSSQNLAASLLSLLGVFLAGLALNLTPCVYPMLSVTVSLFSGRQTMTRGQSFLRALLYVLGISTMYSALGLAAALTGGFFGALLQNPLVLTAVALFLLLLSLSLFGVYTFQLPDFVRNRAQAVKMTNLLGIYGSGVLVGVFAAPCIGPPVLALLAYVGSVGNPGYGFFLFFVLSLGLGFPYLLLGTFSGLIRRIPKSGAWMVWVERLFGVVLVSFAAFYLILAWKPHLLGLLVPVSLSVGGLYLGFLEKSEKYPAAFVAIKRVIGISAMAAALFFYFLSLPRGTVQWEPYSETGLAQATARNEPVVLDFYADWCIPCHELDRFTYSDPGVIGALKGFRRFKVDLTRADSPESVRAAEKFDIQGIPAVIFLDEKGSEILEARISGFVPPKDFLQSVSKVVQNRREGSWKNQA